MVRKPPVKKLERVQVADFTIVTKIRVCVSDLGDRMEDIQDLIESGREQGRSEIKDVAINKVLLSEKDDAPAI